MALDAKAIKEEIPDKDVYEPNARRVKEKDQCRTPDSPEGARAVAPRSPISPQIGQNSNLVAPPGTTGRNGSTSPSIVNGTTTPPPAVAATPTASQDPSRVFMKIRRFLGALVQFGQDSSSDVGDRVRSLVLSLASGGLSAEEFKLALQEATNFPLRPYVLPFLKTHIPLLQRELTALARANSQSISQYVRLNENSVFEFAHNPTEHNEIFLPIDGNNFAGSNTSLNGTGAMLKRRASENFFENHQNGPHDWNDYGLPSKRPHHSILIGSTGTAHLLPSHTPLFDYQIGSHSHSDNFLTEKINNGNFRGGDDRDLRSIPPTDSFNTRSGNSGTSRPSGDEEWKNIHTMLNCISAMVDKTKRAITILQQRGVDAHQTYQDSSLAEIKRLTDEKVAEFKRNAEDAVNQVKRQAVIEIQRAVAVAESRAIEIVAQERIKMEKLFADFNKNNSDLADVDNQSNICWKCGRKATETCSGCSLAKYCSAYCQHKDWEQHIKICGTIRVDPATQKIQSTTRPIIGPPSRSSPPQSQSQQQQPQNSVTNGGTSAIK